MGGSGGGAAPKVKPNPYDVWMAEQAKEMWNMGKAQRKGILKEYNYALRGGDPEKLPLYGPTYALARQGPEDDYTAGRANILANSARGGPMQEALANLESSRAAAVGGLPGQISNDLINNLQSQMYGTVFGTPGQAMQTMGSVAGNYGQAQNVASALQAQQQALLNKSLMGLGSGIGSLFGGGGGTNYFQS
jgi:hypothetical protein